MSTVSSQFNHRVGMIALLLGAKHFSDDRIDTVPLRTALGITTVPVHGLVSVLSKQGKNYLYDFELVGPENASSGDLSVAPAPEEFNCEDIIRTAPPVEEATDPPIEEATSPPAEEATEPPIGEATEPPIEATEPPIGEETDPPARTAAPVEGAEQDTSGSPEVRVVIFSIWASFVVNTVFSHTC